MAQSLESRINAALRSAARLKDVEAVITDVENEIADTQIKFDQEMARSIDPALTTPQAREARNNAADLEHDIRRLNASLGMLKEKRQKLVDDDAEAQRRDAYAAAKAERDALAQHIRTRYPEIGIELVRLAERIRACNAACEAVNRNSPKGAEKLTNPEYLARDCGYYWEIGRGGGPITHIAEINLPLLSRSGGYLPVRESTMHGQKDQWEKAIAEDQEFAKRPIPGLEPAEPEAA